MSEAYIFTYRLEASPQNWVTLHDLFGLPEELVSGHLPESRLQVAGAHARYDFDTRAEAPAKWSVATGPDGIAILDWARKHYLKLPALSPPRASSEVFESTGRTEDTPWGTAEEWIWQVERSTLKRSASLAVVLSVWFLPDDLPGQDLKSAWSAVLPPLANEGAPSGVLYRIDYRLHDADPEPVRFQLVDRKDADLDPGQLWIPDEFEEGAVGDPDAAGRAEHEKAMADIIAAARQPWLGELARALERVERGERPTPARKLYSQGPREERAKLFVHQRVLDEVVDTADFVLGLIEEKRSQGLVFDIAQVTRDIRLNAPDAAAHSLLSRLLLVHLVLVLRDCSVDTDARATINLIVATQRAGGDVLGVVVPPALSEELRAAVERVRDLVGRLTRGDLDAFDTLWDDGDPGEFESLPLYLRLLDNLTVDESRVAQKWLSVVFGTFEIEPTPRLRQRNGRNKGWHGSRYQEDAIAGLVDLEVVVNHLDVRLSPNRVLTRPTRMPSGDPFFVALDLLDQALGRPGKERVGVNLALQLDELSVDLAVSTFPTTRSLYIPALFILCPACVPLLWQYILGSIDLSNLRVLVLVMLGNDPSTIADPGFEVRVGPAVVDDVNVLAFAFDAMLAFPPLWVLQTALINILANTLVEGIVDGILEGVQAVIEPPDDWILRLQPLLNLNREGYREYLENAARQVAAQRAAGVEPERELTQAVERLDQLENHTPGGVNRGGFRTEGAGGAHSYALTISQPGLGGNLDHLPPNAPLEGDVTLLLAHDVYRYFLDWAGYGLGYGGPIYRADEPNLQLDGSDELLDFWNHAPIPAQLGDRPEYQTHPPQLTPGDENVDDWVSYSAVAQVSSVVCRYLEVTNPAPDEPIAELCMTIALNVGVTTFTPVTYQICEDLTRLGGWLDKTSGFVDPFDPSDPVPPWAEGLHGVRRIEGLELRRDHRVGLSAEVLDSLGALLEGPNRVRPGEARGSDPHGLIPDGALLSRAAGPGTGPVSSPGGGGLGSQSGGPGGLIVCRRFAGWDVADSEDWLEAQLTLRMPILFGVGDTFPNQVRLLPLLSYRVDTERAVVGELTASAPEGPLGGLLLGPNRAWLVQTMINHGHSLLNLGRAAYSLADHSPLEYAYGPTLDGIALDPDGYTPRALLALHPRFWAPDPEEPPVATHDLPPAITVHTFGTNPGAPNFAINFHVISNILRRVRGE